MTDDRPRPEYGEYATPEQVAAAMGHAYVPPVEPAPAPVTPPPNPSASLRIPGNPIDRFATIFQLGIALVILINSQYFQFAEVYNATASEVGIPITISSSIDRYGWLLLTVNIVLYVATAFFAYWRLRHAKIAFWVPILGFLVFYLFLIVMLAMFTRT